jgi:hypothetical protein
MGKGGSLGRKAADGVGNEAAAWALALSMSHISNTAFFAEWVQHQGFYQ